MLEGIDRFNQGLFMQAIDSFSGAINRYPNKFPFFLFRALTYLALKQEQNAQEDAMRVAEKSPNWPKVSLLTIPFVDLNTYLSTLLIIIG